jgi:2-dehydro-3-deoxyphosphogluconate aldolase/(4S)-4-hydroxy-2-oxoglutarate aldolase
MHASDLIAALAGVRVVPVIDPRSLDSCTAAAEALVQGGATALEITLRSDIAYSCFEAVRAAHPDIVLGAGSVLDPATYDHAVALGADFTISPGRCLALEAHVRDAPVVHVPGVVTPSEIIAARHAGQTLLKFYPAEAAGGAAVLKDLGRIFPEIMLMPSGGIKRDMLPAYAALPGVLSVGGSWMYAEGGAYRPAPEMRAVMRDSITAMRAAPV